MKLTWLLICAYLTLSQSINSRQDKDVDFQLTPPSSWQTSTSSDGNYNFKPLDTDFIGDGNITKINKRDSDSMSDLLKNAMVDQTNPNSKNFEELTLDNGYKVVRDIEKIDMFGMDVEGYYAIIHADDKYYQLTAYYESGMKEMMRDGIDKIMKSFKKN
jgi:hypothetical protein